MDWNGKNGIKFLLFNHLNSCDAINVKIDRSVLDEKLYFKMPNSISFQNWIETLILSKSLKLQ